MVEIQIVKAAEMWSGLGVSDCTEKKKKKNNVRILPSRSNSRPENQSASVMLQSTAFQLSSSLMYHKV